MRARMRYFWNMLKARFLWRYWIVRSLFTPCDCGYGCDWVSPYGFVPEADCPIHDIKGVDMGEPTFLM